MARRPTEDFIHHYDLLVSRTGNSPNAVRAALNRDDQLAASVRELDDIWQLVERHRRFSKRRFIVQAHPKFWRAFDDYEKRWKEHAMDAVWNWEAEQRGEEIPGDWIGLLLGESDDNAPVSISTDQHEMLEWQFDPDEHSAASAIDFAEQILELESHYDADGPHIAACSRALGAFKWLRETVGLDIAEVETWWREFPVIVVPKHVSDRHGIEEPRSLFGYLTQIRLAYIIGADFAAIAMCRAATDILVRFHYNSGDNTTKLGPLIRSTEKRRDGSVLKKWNIGSKVEEANDILHVNQDDISHRDRSRALILDWVKALQEMIVERGRSNE
jgi:hypothetical protein